MPHNEGKTPDEIADRIARIAEGARRQSDAPLSKKDAEAIKAQVLEAVSRSLDHALVRFTK